MLVLQSCTDSLRVLSSSSSETFATSSDGTYDVGNIKVEEDVDVIEEGFIAVNKEADIGIKQEEIPEDITFPDIKTEPDEVSYVCSSVIRHTLPLSRNVFFFCQYFWPIETPSLLGMKMFCCHWFFLGGVEVVGGWDGPYKMGLSASNCREDENTFLYPCREKIHIHQIFPKGWTNS
jgi:hypothetical protein